MQHVSSNERGAVTEPLPASQRGASAEPVRAVLFTDEEKDLVEAIRRAFESGADEVFVVSLERLFDDQPAAASPTGAAIGARSHHGRSRPPVAARQRERARSY